MHVIYLIFGTEHDLNSWQIAARSFALFIYTLFLLRISGRRSFGMHQPFDNLLAILLGAILSRGVVGASPMVPILVAGLCLAIFHRIFATLGVFFPKFSAFANGKMIVLYKNGRMIKKNMLRCQVSEHDILEATRLSEQDESLENLDVVYMERSGQISFIKKKN